MFKLLRDAYSEGYEMNLSVINDEMLNSEI